MNRFMDVVADFFGTVTFIIMYNFMTGLWIWSGEKFPRFIDHWPFNFYTFFVSWMAINMTSFVLLKENHSKARQKQEDDLNIKRLEAIIRNTEESALTNELVRQLSTNMLDLMEYNLNKEMKSEHESRSVSPVSEESQ